MLKALQKAVGIKPEANAELTALQAEFNEFKETAEALMAAAEEREAELAAKLEEANAKLAEVAEAVAAAEAAKAQAEADALAAVEAALAAKLAARKDKLIAAVGTERADALLALEMDDAAFEAVVAALGVSAAVEAASPLFNEAGVDAQADAAQVVESAEMRILKAKFGKK